MPLYNEHQSRRVLEHAAIMLEHYSADDLTIANNTRFEEPPPPYTSSADSTRLQSPVQLVTVDEVEAIRLRADSRHKAMPKSMFELQTRREVSRILHQISASSSGRRQTLHFDKSLEIRANAENNVRQYWLQDGIWDDAWGNSWSSNHLSQDKPILNETGGASGPRPYGHWRHEGFGTSDSHSLVGSQSDKAAEASRPYRQFNSQVKREQSWIKDERDWKALVHGDDRGISDSEEADVGIAARQAISQFWREHHIWQPQWLSFPGKSWAHECPDASLENHPLYHQLYNDADEPLAEASTFAGSQPNESATLPNAIVDIFDTDIAARSPGRTSSRRASARQQGQQRAGARRSQRLKDQEAKKIRRSLRLQQQQAGTTKKRK